MASEQEIIKAIKNADTPEVKIRVIDQLGHKIKPQHRELIAFLVDLSRKEHDHDISYAVKRALFQIRSRYNITNFPLFLMDPISLIQSSDPAYRIKALEIFERKSVTLEQCYSFLGSIYFEDDPFVLSKMMKILPKLSSHLPLKKVEVILKEFLGHENNRVRANAVEALSTIRDRISDDQSELLWNCLHDQDQRVRANAIAQLVDESPQDLQEKLSEKLKKSDNYFELLGTLELAARVQFEDEALMEKAARRRDKLERVIEVAPEESPTHLPVEVRQTSAPRVGMLRMLATPFWLIPIILLTLYYNHRLQEVQKVTGVESVQLKKQLEEANKLLDDQQQELNLLKNRKTVLIAEQKMKMGDKIDSFKSDGKLLKKNADVFFKTAVIRFKEEKYGEAVKLFKSLYDVYKDNRLAVDSVRWLSKTQKIQNVMASVNDYLSKRQFISASKKLEEIRHLIDKANYDRNLNNIREAQKKHKGRKMIAYIKGVILLREPGRVIINTGNLGFSVSLDQKTELKLAPIGKEQELFTFQIFRENEQSLYGFDSMMKLETFELLLGANKVGPKIALSFISSLRPEDILVSILSEDIKSFGKVPGAGKKLLSQVQLDCKSKAQRLAEKYGVVLEGTSDAQEPDEFEFSAEATVLDALKKLGFTPSEIKASMKHVGGLKGSEKFTDEQTISACLKYFYSKS